MWVDLGDLTFFVWWYERTDQHKIIDGAKRCIYTLDTKKKYFHLWYIINFSIEKTSVIGGYPSSYTLQQWPFRCLWDWLFLSSIIVAYEYNGINTAPVHWICIWYYRTSPWVPGVTSITVRASQFVDAVMEWEKNKIDSSWNVPFEGR